MTRRRPRGFDRHQAEALDLPRWGFEVRWATPTDGGTVTLHVRGTDPGDAEALDRAERYVRRTRATHGSFTCSVVRRWKETDRRRTA